MAGRTPQQALNNFLPPIQQALSCITGAVLIRSHSSSQPGAPRSIQLPARGSFVSLRGEKRLQAWFAIEYEIVQVDDPDRGPWKVKTRQYWYHVVAADLTEVILFHWHPDGRSTEQGPHLHVGSSQLTSNAVVSNKMHVPTGRVSLELVINLLIRDFNVVPLRADWQDVLARGNDRFEQWRTWS